jgi:uncharacterized membrane protein YjgN (DUF898 family)
MILVIQEQKARSSRNVARMGYTKNYYKIWVVNLKKIATRKQKMSKE